MIRLVSTCIPEVRAKKTSLKVEPGWVGNRGRISFSSFARNSFFKSPQLCEDLNINKKDFMEQQQHSFSDSTPRAGSDRLLKFKIGKKFV